MSDFKSLLMRSVDSLTRDDYQVIFNEAQECGRIAIEYSINEQSDSKHVAEINRFNDTLSILYDQFLYNKKYYNVSGIHRTLRDCFVKFVRYGMDIGIEKRLGIAYQSNPESEIADYTERANKLLETLINHGECA